MPQELRFALPSDASPAQLVLSQAVLDALARSLGGNAVTPAAVTPAAPVPVPLSLPRVQPGDLITAEMMNLILATLEALDRRIAALEGSTGQGLAITGLLPPDPFRVGDEITLLGRDFQFSIGATRVFFNSSKVQELRSGSNDTRLVLRVPEIPGLPASGMPVTLTVGNQGQSVSRSVVVLPRQVTLEGHVDLEWRSVDPVTLQPDQPATFQYRITSRATTAADFLLAATIGSVANSQAWQDRVQILNSNLTPLPDRKIHLAPGEQQVFNVRVGPVPPGTAGASFTLTVNAGAGNGAVSGTSGASQFQVGTATTPPDNTISMALAFVLPETARSGDTVTVAAGQQAQIGFNADFRVAGTYDLTLSLVAPTANWRFARDFGTPTFYEIRETDFGPDGSASKVPQLILEPLAGASPTGQVEFRLQRRGEASGQTRRLQVHLP